MFAPYDNRTKCRTWEEFLGMCEAMREVDAEVRLRLEGKRPYAKRKTRDELKTEYAMSA